MSCIDDTTSIDLAIASGILTAALKVSAQPNNQASVLADGIFVGLSVPPAVTVPYAGATAPSGWLLCDGTAVNRSTYAALFAAVGTAYGAGDGSTTFNLPDMRGRMPVGVGTHTDVDTRGDNDGSALASRRPKHGHGTHTHIVGREVFSLTSGATAYSMGPTIAGGATYDTPTQSAQVGPSTLAPVDAPAYLALNFLIKT